MVPENFEAGKPIFVPIVTDDGESGSPIAFSFAAGVDDALFEIDGRTGAVAFKTVPDFETPNDVGGNNVYNIRVQAGDGMLAVAETVSIWVTDVPEGGNDERPSEADAYIAFAGTPLLVAADASVLINDGSSSLAAAFITDGPDHGQIQFEADGTFSYMPDAGFTGIDRYQYRYTDGQGASAETEVRIHVTPLSGQTPTTMDLVDLTSEEQIASTYVAFFGRSPDAEGFRFWVNEYESGAASQEPALLFANIANSFGVSDEAKVLYPFLQDPFTASESSIQSFLERVYENLFNRSVDSEGLGYWTGQIRDTPGERRVRRNGTRRHHERRSKQFCRAGYHDVNGQGLRIPALCRLADRVRDGVDLGR